MCICSEEEEAVEPKVEEKPKKVATKVVADRWAHDMFDENEQTPKSQDELATRYGYDIRSDDMAPRANRRRKYGYGITSAFYCILNCNRLNLKRSVVWEMGMERARTRVRLTSSLHDSYSWLCRSYVYM
jgi:hypothetical protein